MATKNVSVSLSPIIQTTEGSVQLSDRLNQLLSIGNLKRFRAAVSYVRWSGLGLLATKLEEFLRQGGELQTIYGIDNGITSPDSLLYSIYLQTIYENHSYAGTIEDTYQNATFHPKFFEFQFKDKTIAIIGSGNLTAGGLVNNTELACQVEFSNSDKALVTGLDAAWSAFKSLSQAVTLTKIRELKENKTLGSELDPEAGQPSDKPFIKHNKKAAKKPLFLKVLDVKKVAIRHELLAKLDALTEKPKKLYLEILEYETGAQKTGAGAGYQVQLPAATLALFFGVAPDRTEKVSFQFSTQNIEVSLSHFKNKTHRVRLKPIQNIPRPAIVIFERLSKNSYQCTIVPPKRYTAVLEAKCTERTRPGARRWGIA
jgi:HKD family nuclease